ncbi:polysaccharide pyruvyl transferase family protein [Aquidulcibacter paucihalophilus]|uniref:polysaccharide pyruvyl transferase family protein n=1 Tax=Aquidulcibacter paucihalophilus TaxID=1978549 RepID=UPI000A18F7C5|nr:polysaccharide pyruvyl transferase family protein [Aquidulcibacter paucihalophilus]
MANSSAGQKKARTKFRPFLMNHNLLLESGSKDPFLLDEALLKLNGNTGNGYITYALSRFIDFDPAVGLANMFDRSALGTDVVEYINSEFSHVLLVLQDQLSAGANELNWDQLYRFVAKIERPIVAFSVGSNAISQSPREIRASLSRPMVKFYRLLASKSVSLGVRGAITADLMSLLGIKNIAAVGCPTWYEAGPKRVVPYPELDRTKRIVATGLFSHFETSNIDYILQSEAAVLRATFESDITKPVHDDFSNISYPFYYPCFARAFFRGRIFLDPSYPDWKARFGPDVSFACGTRVHGSIIAMNSNVPALCTAGDTRSFEMADLLKFPLKAGHCAADSSLEELYEMADPTAANSAYSGLYNAFCEWLVSCGLKLKRPKRTHEPGWEYGKLLPLDDFQRSDRFMGLFTASKAIGEIG